MATPTITKIQLRRDTASNWSSSTVPLLEGEPGFDTDQNILKIGPVGGSVWNNIGPTGTFYPGINSGGGSTGNTGSTGFTGPISPPPPPHTHHRN